MLICCGSGWSTPCSLTLNEERDEMAGEQKQASKRQQDNCTTTVFIVLHVTPSGFPLMFCWMSFFLFELYFMLVRSFDI